MYTKDIISKRNELSEAVTNSLSNKEAFYSATKELEEFLKIDWIKKDTVKISNERHEELLRIERQMSALEATGVDNWEGYCIAMSELDEEDRF